ncbi:hypothetical protein CsatB_021980 [Cannabis sativa]|uniref:Uncharacterized protein n=1 Tax=Cannabis sativa TaxID=3483 RepID=A0A7J6HJB9_CANSA|nr:uncharacterized protein LOC133033375 [Cannabis sativa]KAF4360769.1 hypothetical protein F8388_015092 [Cannabis sativa]KAF4395362.1 hypothetical protein G4B88_010826 [Cannabis sativa]
MLGTGLQFGGRGRGEDRFYNSAKARRAQQNQRAEQLRRAQSDVTPSPSSSSSSVKETTVQREPDNHVDRVSFGEPQKPIAMPVIEPVSPLSNLERFVQSITPSVPTQYPSKTTMKGWSGEVESRPFFVLGDLWESFKEWSAYGAGVPLVLNDSDCVIQYYVPYLSGIQIYGDSAKLSVKQRRPDEDSDSDFRDSSSDGSSDCETERLKYMREQHSQHNLSSDVSRRIDRLSLRDHPSSLQDDFSSDDGESAISQSCLIFEYLERDPPYSRVPLADKLADLAFRLPELKSLRSCDLLRSSWISVAWYPIYRIPTGPTLKDLDACFLTYHHLHTPMGGVWNACAPVVMRPSATEGVPKMSLPVFGLASYKFRGSLWTANGGSERILANSLSQAADDWLRQLQVNHPDFLFFSRR